MGKISELDMVISDLRKAAATINDVADTLAEMFSGTATEEASVKEPPLTLEQVRTVLAKKARYGHTAEVRALLQKYGAAKLSLVDPVHYKDLLHDAEVLPDAT